MYCTEGGCRLTILLPTPACVNCFCISSRVPFLGDVNNHPVVISGIKHKLQKCLMQTVPSLRKIRDVRVYTMLSKAQL